MRVLVLKIPVAWPLTWVDKNGQRFIEDRLVVLGMDLLFSKVRVEIKSTADRYQTLVRLTCGDTLDKITIFATLFWWRCLL
jgi:hypothetical protein